MLNPALIFLRHLAILTQEELREAFVRRRSLLAFLIYLLSVGVCIPLLVRFDSALFEMVRSLLTSREGQAALTRLPVQLSPALSGYLMRLLDWTPALWLFQLLSLLVIPSLVGLASADMIAGDVYRGTLRYVLYRSSRTAYFLSKMLAHLLAYLMLHAAALVVLVLLLLRAHPAASSRLFAQAALGYLAFVPFIVCVLAVTQFVSAFCRKPMTAVLFLEIFWFLSLTMLGFAPRFSIFSGPLVAGLILPEAPYVTASFAGYGGWAAGFSALGLVLFLRRDI